MSDWIKRARDWIEKQWYLIMIFALMVASAIFIAWLVTRPLPVPPGY